MVEAALVLPLCLVLLLAFSDFGRLVMTRQLLDNAARSRRPVGRRQHQHPRHHRHPELRHQRLGGQSLNNMTIQVYQVNPATGTNLGPWTSTPLGSYIAVEIDGNFQPMCPGISLIPNPLPMTTK